MRTWIMLFMLAFTALAGCADGSEDTDDTDADDGSDDGSDDGTGGSTGGDGDDTGTGGDSNRTNTPPAAELSADVINGTAPLGVNFTVDGSDPDGDNITWIVAINGTDTAQGDTFPATFNHTFDVGEFFVELSVFDGVNATFANVTITVAAGGAEDLGPCGGEPEPCIIEEHPWVTVWSDGRCDAKGAQGGPTGFYVQDRPGAAIQGQGNPAGGDWPYGTGFVSGGGTWIYEETNGIDGLQLNDNDASLDGSLGPDGFAVERGCIGGDTMVF